MPYPSHLIANQRAGAARAAATLVAVVASFCSVYAMCRFTGAGDGPAIVAAVMTLSLARRPRPATGAQLALAPVVLPFVAAAASGEAWLLHAMPLLGALVFVAGMFVSVWLRNFGKLARSAGTALALPLVALLIVPAGTAAPGGRTVDLALAASAGLAALTAVTALQWFSRRAGIALVTPEAPEADKSDARPGLQRSPATRMALQMAVALGAAFAAGFAIFPAHWGWTVVTTFIVSSGALGRGDALYKGVLRLFGALAGTLCGVALARVPMPNGAFEAATIFVILFFALWLRERNYAYWAACVTLILGLLAGSGSEAVPALLGARLEAVFVGALCAVAACWFVLPIRTEDVVRRRLADALKAFDDALADADTPMSHERRLAAFDDHLGRLALVAPPLRWHRRLSRTANAADHPARWIDLALGLSERARAFATDTVSPQRRGAVRRAIGTSRRAIAGHRKPDAPAGRIPVGTALERLHDELSATNVDGK